MQHPVRSSPPTTWGTRTAAPDGETLYADIADGQLVWRRADELSEVAAMHHHVGPAWERFVARSR
jgi:hypothetical protein